jgi:hypothetical protein
VAPPITDAGGTRDTNPFFRIYCACRWHQRCR